MQKGEKYQGRKYQWLPFQLWEVDLSSRIKYNRPDIQWLSVLLHLLSIPVSTQDFFFRDTHVLPNNRSPYATRRSEERIVKTPPTNCSHPLFLCLRLLFFRNTGWRRIASDCTLNCANLNWTPYFAINQSSMLFPSTEWFHFAWTSRRDTKEGKAQINKILSRE